MFEKIIFYKFLLNFHPKAKLWWKGGQIYILSCNFQNMGHNWPIFHQSWVKISSDGLENKFNDSHVNKDQFQHQEVAKMCQIQVNWSLSGSKSCFMVFLKKYGICMAHIAPILIQISYNGWENYLDDSQVNKAWFWHQKVAKICQMQGNRSLRGSKLRFMLFHKIYGI